VEIIIGITKFEEFIKH